MENQHINMEFLQKSMVDIAEILGVSTSISTAFGCCNDNVPFSTTHPTIENAYQYQQVPTLEYQSNDRIHPKDAWGGATNSGIGNIRSFVAGAGWGDITARL